jgi:hypothetical protein
VTAVTAEAIVLTVLIGLLGLLVWLCNEIDKDL